MKILESTFGSGISARLHRCKINGRQTHTVILVTINNLNYIIDVGMGFPIMKLIPCHKTIIFKAFGITFKTEIKGQVVRLFSDMSGEDREVFELDRSPQCNENILTEINQRFSDKSVYPFAGNMRYFAIMGDKYVQIKHDGIMDGGDRPVVRVFTD